MGSSAYLLSTFQRNSSSGIGVGKWCLSACKLTVSRSVGGAPLGLNACCCILSKSAPSSLPKSELRGALTVPHFLATPMLFGHSTGLQARRRLVGLALDLRHFTQVAVVPPQPPPRLSSRFSQSSIGQRCHCGCLRNVSLYMR